MVGFARRDIDSSWYIPDIQFIPQGFIICFYGSLVFRLGLSLFFVIILSIGTGFNEYNKKTKQITIFRWGFPGKNRRFKLSYLLTEIEFLILESQNRFLDANNFYLYLILINKQKVLLIKFNIFNINTIEEVEYFSADLAQFLKIPLKRNF